MKRILASILVFILMLGSILGAASADAVRDDSAAFGVDMVIVLDMTNSMQQPNDAKKGNDIYHRALSMCRRAGFKPQVPMYLDQMLTSYHVAANGHGIAFIRAGMLDHVKTCSSLYFYQIDDPGVTRSLYLYRRKGAPMSLLAREFWNFMHAEARE